MSRPNSEGWVDKTQGNECAGTPSEAGDPSTIEAPEESGRAALQRPRPGTGGISSHADSTYLVGDDLDGFAGWFADWWLRRGRKLAGDREGG